MVMEVFLFGCAMLSLLIIAMCVAKGRIQIENVCDIKVREKPLTFIALIVWATVLAGGIAYLCGLGLWGTLMGMAQTQSG